MELRTDDDKCKYATKMLENLKRQRSPYEVMIDEVITFVNHSRRKITDTEGNRGIKTGESVFDGTTLSALNLATSGICGYSVSKSFNWFRSAIPGKLNFPRTSGMRAWSGKRVDEYPEVKIWLEETDDVLYAAYLRSNFYDQITEIVREALSVGTVSPLIEEDIPNARTMFTIPHFREIFFAENRYGWVNTRYRLYYMTVLLNLLIHLCLSLFTTHQCS